MKVALKSHFRKKGLDAAELTDRADVAAAGYQASVPQNCRSKPLGFGTSSSIILAPSCVGHQAAGVFSIDDTPDEQAPGWL
ncbi:hypothetical protein PI124_g17080 [Phytophthora idaei]|nr:hypothetical protein PI125_g18314 [Phytophthora idaei]KAG3156106.1 hypothetical protein PI126_g8888 [Phytophthora idaei]KAG3237944.1 hypothetical protein PI124_g17080 [Phytophthora idaei]